MEFEYYIGINDYGGTFSSGSYAGDHLLKWAWPFAYLWKDGAIKDFIESDGGASCAFCNSQYWFPFTITSGTSGSVPTILNINTYTNQYLRQLWTNGRLKSRMNSA